MSNIWITGYTEKKEKSEEHNSSRKQFKKISKNSRTYISRLKGPSKRPAQNRWRQNSTKGHHCEIQNLVGKWKIRFASQGKKNKVWDGEVHASPFPISRLCRGTESNSSARGTWTACISPSLTRNFSEPTWKKVTSKQTRVHGMVPRGALDTDIPDCSQFSDLWIGPESIRPPETGSDGCGTEAGHEGDSGWGRWKADTQIQTPWGRSGSHVCHEGLPETHLTCPHPQDGPHTVNERITWPQAHRPLPTLPSWHSCPRHPEAILEWGQSGPLKTKTCKRPSFSLRKGRVLPKGTVKSSNYIKFQSW